MISQQPFSLLSVIDLTFIFCLIYFFFYVIKRTQIQNLMPVIVSFIAAYSLSKMIGLTWFSWMVEQFSIIFIVFVMIIFKMRFAVHPNGFDEANYFFHPQQNHQSNPF